MNSHVTITVGADEYTIPVGRFLLYREGGLFYVRIIGTVHLFTIDEAQYNTLKGAGA